MCLCDLLYWISTTSICSTFLLGKASHKDVKDSTNWLFKAYYGNRMFMAYCCVACEVIKTWICQFTESKSLHCNGYLCSLDPTVNSAGSLYFPVSSCTKRN